MLPYNPLLVSHVLRLEPDRTRAMKASTIWLLLLILVLTSILIFWEPLIGGGFPSPLPALGLVLGIFLLLLVAMPESRNSFRVVLAVLAANRAMRKADYDGADQSLRRALALSEQTGRASDQNLGQVMYHLAELHRLLGRYGEAELLYVQALRHLREAYKPTHRFRLYTQHNLGVVYILQGRYAEAEAACTLALDLMSEKLGTGHGHTAVARCNLAKCFQGQGRFAEAEEIYRQVLRQLDANRHPADRMTRCVCRHNLADLLLEQNRLPEVEALLRQALAELDRTELAGRQEATRLLHTQAELARLQGKPDEAEAACQQFLRQADEVFPRHHPIQADGWLTLARLRTDAGKFAEAADLYQRCWTVWEPLLAPEHTHRARCCLEYADLLRRLGREADATQLTARSKQSPVWVQAANDPPH
jgi:tetratricopeptide (TPR) repeat protein